MTHAVLIRWGLGPAIGATAALLAGDSLVVAISVLVMVAIATDVLLDLPRGPASALPILYLVLAGFLGAIAVALPNSGVRSTAPSDPWAAGYALVAAAAWGGRRIGLSRRHHTPTSAPVSNAAIWGMTLCSGAAVFAILTALPPNFFTDPQANRAALLSAITPTVGTLYRLTIFAAIAWFLRNAERLHGRKLVASQGLVLALAAAALSLYGGRLLAVLAVLGGFAVYTVRARKVRWGRIAVFAISAYCTLAAYAAYRYYAFFGQSLTREGFFVTLASQGSGEYVDGLRIATLGANSEAASTQLLRDLAGSVPSALRGPLGLPSSESSFGGYAAVILGQIEVGGIRVGLVGEWLTAWGVLGALALGLLLAVCNGVIARSEMRRGRAQFLAIASALSIVGVLIAGSATLVAYVLAVGLAAMATTLLPAAAASSPVTRTRARVRI